MRQRAVAVLGMLIACGGDDHGGDPPDARRGSIDAAIVDGAAVDAVTDAGAPDATVTAATVGSAGGTLTTPDGVVLVIPPGALTADTPITIRRVDEPIGGVVSEVYELGPDGTQLAVPAALTIPYDPGRLGSTPEGELAIATRQGVGSFQGTGWTQIDGVGDLATAFISHFSQWAVVPAPPASSCQVNYACMQTCAGVQIPDLCCSQFRRTCRSWLITSFPDYVTCYATCVGTPQIANFGTSACMSDCCTDSGWTVMHQGACYRGDATLGDAQAVLDCGRACFASPDTSTLCGTGAIQFDACSWQTVITQTTMGEECDPAPGGGLEAQLLLTDMGNAYFQTWGTPPLIDVDSGFFDNDQINLQLSCSSAVAASGTMDGTWSGSAFTGTWTFGANSGVFEIAPNW